MERRTERKERGERFFRKKRKKIEYRKTKTK
jgi:hypothetical protein